MPARFQIIGGIPEDTIKYTFTSDDQKSLEDMGCTISKNMTPTGGGKAQALSAFISVENQAVRVIRDTAGTKTPSDETGHDIEPGDAFKLDSYQQIEGFRFIPKISGLYPTLNITVFF